MVDWNAIGDFERHDKLNDMLVKVGDTVGVKFLDDGKEVKAEVLKQAYKNSGKKGLTAKDTLVFIVEHNKEKRELWVGATSYTNLQELKRIRSSNGDTLVNAKVKVSRVSKDNPEMASLSFEKA